MTTYTTIDFPSAISTTAYGINDDGQIVGTYTDSLSRQHGFLISGSLYLTIDDPAAINTSVAAGINNKGQIVGYYIDSSSDQYQGFLFDGGAFHIVGNLIGEKHISANDPTGGVLATGINDLGWIVGRYSFFPFIGFIRPDLGGHEFLVEHPSANSLLGGTQVLGRVDGFTERDLWNF